MPFPSPTEKQARVLWNTMTAVAVAVCLFLIALAIAGFGWLLNRLSTVLIPLAVSAVLAYLLDPVVDWVERRSGLPRVRAVAWTFAGIGLILFGFCAAIVPKLFAETVELGRPYLESIPASEPASGENGDGDAAMAPELLEALRERIDENARKVTSFLEDLNQRLGSLFGANVRDALSNTWDQRKDSIVDGLIFVGTAIAKWFLGIFRGVFSGVGSVLGYTALMAMTPLFSFYFLVGKRAIVRSWTEYLPVTHPVWKREAVFVLTSINDSLIAFFRGQVLVAMIIGFLLMIGFGLLGLKYAVLLGLMAGVFSIIPYLGMILSIVPAVLLAIVQFGDLAHPIGTVAIFAATQVFEALVVTPKVMGDRVGLHPLTIIIAVLVGASLLGGIAGGILAIPLTAALRAIMIRYVWKKDPASSFGAEAEAEGEPASEVSEDGD